MAADTFFAGFHVTTPVYKKVDGHEITLNVLIPKGVRPGKLPLIVRWHGGFLVYLPPTSQLQTDCKHADRNL
jgi:hypothetical protein